MRTDDVPIVSFVKELMRRRQRLPSQMAADLDISHVTVGRWLSGEDSPSPRSCQKLAEYSGVSLEKILSLAGHLPSTDKTPIEWPEFREYARRRYRSELDDDLMTMVEDLIKRRRANRYGRQDS